MYLVRKISRAKWDKQFNTDRGLAKEEISADAVTGDLRTQSNSLSFWRCSASEPNSIGDAALAIAAAGDRLDKLDIVWISDSELCNDGHVLRSTKGRTSVRDLVETHVDICNLDYTRLGRIAERVYIAIQDQHCRRLSRTQVKKLLESAIRHGRIASVDLRQGVRSEILG